MHKNEVFKSEFEFTGNGETESGKRVTIKFKTNMMDMERDSMNECSITMQMAKSESDTSFFNVSIEEEKIDFKEVMLNKLEELHMKINYHYEYGNDENGLVERLKHRIRYEQLKEIVRDNPEWDSEEVSDLLSERISERVSVN